jgi:hypothetical protein
MMMIIIRFKGFIANIYSYVMISNCRITTKIISLINNIHSTTASQGAYSSYLKNGTWTHSKTGNGHAWKEQDEVDALSYAEGWTYLMEERNGSKCPNVDIDDDDSRPALVLSI